MFIQNVHKSQCFHYKLYIHVYVVRGVARILRKGMPTLVSFAMIVASTLLPKKLKGGARAP